MLSKNEWDPLKSVIVGIADHARIPYQTIGLRCVNYADKDFGEVQLVPHGMYPTQVIQEANEDLNYFVEFLKEEGIRVFRPNRHVEPEYYNVCPRDTVLIHDDVILAAPTALSCRKNEWKSSRVTFSEFGEVIRSPEPDYGHMYNSQCIGDPDTLALTETSPCFDAANILRANDDLYYLVSNTGNRKGAEYLQSLLPNKNVHMVENIYSYIHIDSTIAFLREGLMLLNPSRVQSVDQLPESLRGWDVIWAPEPTDIGHHPKYNNASPWINVNLFSINPNLVVLEEHQHDTRKLLESHGIDCAMLPMRHARTLGGCFHCVTLDIERG